MNRRAVADEHWDSLLIELAAQRHFGGELPAVSPEIRAFLRKNVRIDIDVLSGNLETIDLLSR